MKILKFVIGLLFFLFVFSVTILVILGPISGDLAACYKKASSSFDETLKRAGEGRWEEERICLENRDTLGELRQCTQQVQVMNNLPINFIERLTKVLQPKLLLFGELTDWHNRKCSEYPHLSV